MIWICKTIVLILEVVTMAVEFHDYGSAIWLLSFKLGFYFLKLSLNSATSKRMDVKFHEDRIMIELLLTSKA